MTTTAKSFVAKDWAIEHAQSHYATDAGITEIYYLPDGAAADEVRLADVNRQLFELTGATSEPLTMGIDIGGEAPHYLSIIDVTPHQWEEIEAGRLPLPPGWSLTGKQLMPRP